MELLSVETLEGDGDNEYTLVIHNIDGSNQDYCYSNHVGQSGNYFATGYIFNRSDEDPI
ncbi:MAG: hypothetical protein RMJ36_04515 [Candidatus Calescibacterium sp.]|nr:hypothetical protein [Candidatus Calescibacterium sp.]MDW8132897.1 hypothetical protein [Candidatus Calescibacterium sp.]